MDLITGSLPETVVILSIENKIKYANKSFNKLFNFIDEEIENSYQYFTSIKKIKFRDQQLAQMLIENSTKETKKGNSLRKAISMDHRR